MTTGPRGRPTVVAMTPPRARRVTPPALPEPQLGDLADLASIAAGGRYDDARLTGDLGVIRAPDVTMLGSAWDGVRLDQAEFPGLRLIESRITDLHATALSVAGGEWREVLALDGRVGLLRASGVTWQSVGLRGLRLDYLELRGARLRSVVLQDCVIGDLDLTGATAERVALRGCRVDRLDAGDARLTDVDLTGADIAAIAGVPGLRGATITAGQAALFGESFAVALGLRLAP